MLATKRSGKRDGRTKMGRQCEKLRILGGYDFEYRRRFGAEEETAVHVGCVTFACKADPPCALTALTRIVGFETRRRHCCAQVCGLKTTVKLGSAKRAFAGGAPDVHALGIQHQQVQCPGPFPPYSPARDPLRQGSF